MNEVTIKGEFTGIEQDWGVEEGYLKISPDWDI